MADKVDIWMPLYVRDYIGATSRLTTEQHGAYLLLIMDYWLNGPPPDDDSILASIVRLSSEQWSKHRPSIERLFSIHDGEWRHKRIQAELDAAKDRKKLAVERGKRGAKVRWAKENRASNGASIDAPSSKQSSKDSSSPSSSPTPTPSQSTSEKRGAPSGDPPPKAKQKRGTRIPDDFPTDDELLWATQEFPRVDHNREAAKFQDYWKAIPGSKGVKLDWPATWRNWIRKAAEFKGTNGSKPPMADDYSQKTYEGTADEDLPAALR